MKVYMYVYIVLAVCAVLILSGCDALTRSQAEIDHEAQLEECSAYVADLIPDNLTLERPIGESKLSIFKAMEAWHEKEAHHWRDGTSIGYPPCEFIYQKGSRAGENVNFYYPSPKQNDFCTNDTMFLSYSRQNIDDEGNILAEYRFKISPPVLSIIANTSYTARYAVRQQYKVESYELLDCEIIN